MYPMKLKAPLKDYLWGGSKLKEEYNKSTEKSKVAESWELSCHKDGNSLIQNGANAGETLISYIERSGKGILGKNGEKFENFPVLIKLIDAKENLSVQVHPNNDYAMRVEGEYGKTEMWYIVECDEGAELLYGFKAPIEKAEFEQRIADNTLLSVTNAVKVKKGDVFFIEAGTLHAIGAGIMIAEIQQNSNTTYRIYDYGRVGADGKPRDLHVAKALDVTKLTPPQTSMKKGERIPYDGYAQTLLSSCEYFTAYSLEVETAVKFVVDDNSFCSLLCLEGAFTLKTPYGEVVMQKGDSIFLEANMGECTAIGKGEIIKTNV